MRSRVRTLLLCCFAASAAAASAGTVEVSFVNPTSYIDAGKTQWDEKANLEALGKHLEALGQRLPADQALKIEVLDVDLAGTVKPGSEVRVVRGRADYPRIHLRYTLRGAGVQRSGDEWVKDLDYARGPRGVQGSESLYFEKRMLDAWFKARFGALPG